MHLLGPTHLTRKKPFYPESGLCVIAEILTMSGGGYNNFQTHITNTLEKNN